MSPTLRVQRIPLVGRLLIKPEKHTIFPPNVEYGDIVDGLPVQENSCRAVYCSHTLEHLSLEDCRRALANTYRYLEPGGIFRLVLPDLRALATAYLEHGGPDAAPTFMERSMLGSRQRPRGVVALLKH